MRSVQSIHLIGKEHFFTLKQAKAASPELFNGGTEVLEVMRRCGVVKDRVVSVVVGITGQERSLGVHSKGVDTLAVAIYGRVMRYELKGEYQKPLPCLNDPNIDLLWFKKRLLSCYGLAPTPLTRQEFVEMYTGRRKTIYNNAVNDLSINPVSKRDSFVTPFVKCEKVKLAGCPRVIQPRNPRYNVEVGVYIKPVEHYIYRAIARVYKQKCVVAKGVNVEKLGAIISNLWDEVDDCVFIGLDAHRFDMHVTARLLSYEHSIYNELYKHDRKLAWLLKMQLKTKGKGWCEDGYVKYKTTGRRCSGDMNTGLGNCLLMCALAITFRRKFKLKFKFINNGDDCGVFISRKYIKAFTSNVEEFFVGYGFRMGVEPLVMYKEQIVFCQMSPINIDGIWRMVRQIDVAREKDSISTTKFTSEIFMRKWLYAVGECGLALCSGVPIMQEMYCCYMRNGIKSNMDQATYMECGARILARNMAVKRMKVKPSTRASLWLSSDYNAEDQIDLEEYYRTLVISYGDNVASLSEVAPSGYR